MTQSKNIKPGTATNKKKPTRKTKLLTQDVKKVVGGLGGKQHNELFVS